MRKIFIFLTVLLLLFSCSLSNNNKCRNKISMQEAEDLIIKVLQESRASEFVIINKVRDKYNVVCKDTNVLEYFYLSDLYYFKKQNNIILVNTSEAMKSDWVDVFMEISFDKIINHKLIINVTFTFTFNKLMKGFLVSQSHSMYDYVFEKQLGKWIFKEIKDEDSFIIE